MIAAKKWPSTKNLRWLQRCKSIFVIPTAHGREAQMKTQTGLLEAFFQKEQTLLSNQREIKLGSKCAQRKATTDFRIKYTQRNI